MQKIPIAGTTQINCDKTIKSAQFLKRAVISITDACNLKCKHCYNGLSANVNNHNQFLNRELFASLKKLGVKQIALSGGEPLIVYDFLCNILELISSFDFSVVLTTNGILLNEKKLKALTKLGVTIFQVSIDGYNADIHEILRGKETFKKIIHLFDGKINQRFKIIPMYVIHKQNYKYIPDFLRFAISHNFSSVGFERFIPCNNHNATSFLELEPNQLEQSYSDIYKFESQIRIHINDPLYNIHKLISNFPDKLSGDFIEMLSSNCKIGCSAFKRSIVIDTNGNIRPCTFTKKVLFNLKDKSIYTIKYFFDKNKNKMLKGKCAKCKFQHICGGCRAYAEHYYKDWQQEDPLCFIS